MPTEHRDTNVFIGGASMLATAALQFGVFSSLHNHTRSATAAAVAQQRFGGISLTAACAPINTFDPATAGIGDCRMAIVKILTDLYKAPV